MGITSKKCVAADICVTFDSGKIVKNELGMTLLEVIISMSIFTISALFIASVAEYQAKNQVLSSNVAKLNQDLLEFSLLIENHLSNATWIKSVTCANTLVDTDSIVGSAVDSCFLGDSTYCSTTSVIEFETETAMDPMALTPTSGTNCSLGNTAATQTDTSFTRGCKKQFKLTYTPPSGATATTPFDAGQPGTLILTDTASSNEISKLTGVYFFRCGFEPTRPDQIATSAPAAALAIEIRAKSRSNNQQKVDLIGDLDSWAPSTWDASQTGPFLKGIHRSLSFSVAFRNISTPGVHFGSTRTISNCISDNQDSTSGLSCCSGYYSNKTGKCLARTSCKVHGEVAESTDESCCSHMMVTGGSTCL